MGNEVETAWVDPRTVPSLTANPYWDLVKVLPGDRLGAMIAGDEDRWTGPARFANFEAPVENMLTEFRRRDDCVAKYSWAIPDPATLEFVRKWSDGRIYEAGAGRGYWAWQLEQLGVDVVATDKEPLHAVKNTWFARRYNAEDVEQHVFFNVEYPDLSEYVADRTLLIVWPPRDSFAFDTVQWYDGNRVIYIGEDQGCNANDAFFELMNDETKWRLTDEHWRMVAWEGIHDYVTVWDRVAI